LVLALFLLDFLPLDFLAAALFVPDFLLDFFLLLDFFALDFFAAAFPPRFSAPGEFAMRAARDLLIPFLRSPSYCLSSLIEGP
jgi:hypothetical protein